ncbi:unnamed protein product [Chironomus riparius]|uniref:Splicing factor 3A subunit 1 n=1 Tax=Chironomus riparius TaxID=315576 RepID=A0A9N9S4X5_9DIPT|nr:unnamed protein product [Chironomus riparius]
MPVIASREAGQISSDGIGLIIPPPELRNIVDKTASFVSRNGKTFEKKILEKEENNKKFNFLKPDDVYNKYYLKKIKDFSDNKSLFPNQEIAKKQQEILKKLTVEEFKPNKPPRKFEFIADPPSLSPLDLNIVKLTAQFVARNGKQFLTNLMNREQKNPEFDFLRPQHILFPYFARMIEQYTKILIPPKDVLKDIKAELSKEGIDKVLNEVKYRAKYIQHEEKQVQIEIDRIEKERIAYNSVDWHDFYVVEEVDYEFGERGNFPKPITPETLGCRLITDLRNEETEVFDDVDMEIEPEIEMDILEDIRTIKLPELTEKTKQVNISDFSSENVTIKKYDPKSIKKPFVASKKEEYLISPLTGEKILASKLSEHMRIGLLDPRWIEQRDKFMEKTQEPSVYGSGETVIDNLKHLAERRTDIFGEGDKETVIGKKIGEEEKKENPVIWDGHMISVESTARAMNKNNSLNNSVQPKHVQSNQFMPSNHVMQSNYVNEVPRPKNTMHNNEFKVPLPPPPQRYPNYQMNIRHRPPMPVPPPLMMMNQPQRYPIQPHPFFQTPFPPTPPISMMFDPPFDIPEEEHPAKKACTESKLIPEDKFIKMFMSPINIQVQVPNVEKSEWKLNGQQLSIDIDLKDTIVLLKQKIQEQTDMPPSKQKISFNGTFLKDNFSAAYYNILNNSTVNLQIKERGGRKK